MKPYIQILQQLAAAIKSVSLYPPDHPSRKNPLMAAYRQIHTLLEKKPVVEIAIREGILTVLDEPLFDAPPALVKLQARLQEKEITLLRFLPSFSQDEIGILLELLAASSDELRSFDGANAYLGKRRVSNIEVEQEDEDLSGHSVRVYNEAKSFIVNLWNDARTGNMPNGDAARRLANDMGNILQRDRSPLMGLTMLSDYDNYTFNHSVNVGVFSMVLAQEMGLNKEDCKVVGLAGLLHDIGKTRVPIEVINKPGKLEGEEWDVMKMHPVYSGELVTDMGLTHIYDMVKQHHCGFNRAGYPELSARAELSDGAMITSVADVYDSMTTTRPYQRCHTPQEAIEVLLKLKERKHLNPDYVEGFLRTLGIYPVGTCVRLEDGSLGFVNKVFRGEENRPVIKLFRTRSGEMLAEPEDIDLRSESSLLIVGTLNPSQFGVKPADFVDPAPAIFG